MKVLDQGYQNTFQAKSASKHNQLVDNNQNHIEIILNENIDHSSKLKKRLLGRIF